MSEVKSRPSGSRGRGSGRGSRGGSNTRSGGGRGGGRQINGDKLEIAETPAYEDQGELGQLKKLHAAKLSTMKEMFPDWTDEDLVFALQETGGNLEDTIERISDGNISQWGEVKKKTKDRSLSKSKDTGAPSGEINHNASKSGRGRGGLDGVRGNRGRGSERGRGGGRGGRGGSTTNGLRHSHVDKSSEPLGDVSSLEPSGKTDGMVFGTEQPSETENAVMEASWENIVVPDVGSAPTAELPKASSKPDGTRSWASIFSKPAPALSPPKMSRIPPTHEAMVEESVMSAPSSTDVDMTGLPPPVPADAIVMEYPNTPTLPGALPEPITNITPSKDELTETNLEQVLDISGPPQSATAASTIASTMDPQSALGSSTPLHNPQQQTSARPPMGGYATTAYKATGIPGRSASFQRKIIEQQEAVVMPGKHAVDRAAVQFGSMGLNGSTEDLDVDSDREEAETRAQPPQHSPIAPRAALPPAPQQHIYSAPPPVDEPLPTPKQAPGLPPVNQQAITEPPGQLSDGDQEVQQAPQSGYPYGQFSNRYGPQAGQPQEASAPAQKAYEPFGQQMHSQYDGYPAISQASAAAPLHQAHSQLGGYTSASTDAPSYYTSDNQRNAYQSQYGNYSQISQQSQQDAGASQQRIGSAFGTSVAEQSSQHAVNQAQHPQARYGQVVDAQKSGNSTPNPAIPGPQQQPQAHQNHHMLQQQQQAQAPSGSQQSGYPYGHPYYASPYYSAYMNQFGYGSNHGGYGNGPFGGTGGKQSLYAPPQQGYGMSPQTSYDQHSSSPANVSGFGQHQPAPNRDGATGGNISAYGRSGSTQPSESQQQYSSSAASGGGYGGIPDMFARSSSSFPGQAHSLGHPQTGQPGTSDDPVRGFTETSKVSGGPSPALGQPSGRPGSAANNLQAQTSLPPPQGQSQSQQGYSGYPSHLNHQMHGQHGSQYGAGPNALGSHHQTGAQNHQGSGYGAYGAGFGGNYYGNNTSRGGWSGNYGGH